MSSITSTQVAQSTQEVKATKETKPTQEELANSVIASYNADQLKLILDLDDSHGVCHACHEKPINPSHIDSRNVEVFIAATDLKETWTSVYPPRELLSNITTFSLCDDCCQDKDMHIRVRNPWILRLMSNHDHLIVHPNVTKAMKGTIVSEAKPSAFSPQWGLKYWYQ